MMPTVMFFKLLLVFTTRRVTAGCILLMKRSFREQTPCSQFSRAGAVDHQPICQWSLENIHSFNKFPKHCCQYVFQSTLKSIQFQYSMWFKSAHKLVGKVNHRGNLILDTDYICYSINTGDMTPGDWSFKNITFHFYNMVTVTMRI